MALLERRPITEITLEDNGKLSDKPQGSCGKPERAIGCRIRKVRNTPVLYFEWAEADWFQVDATMQTHYFGVSVPDLIVTFAQAGGAPPPCPFTGLP